MAPQTVLITGCSTGIGLATAAMLAKDSLRRFKVYATMRNLKSKTKLEEAAGHTLNKTLLIRELDVTKDPTIKSVVDEILRDNGRIDVLVNNAGYMGLDAIDQKSLEWCQDMMDTDFWGVVRATRAVLPAMKKQKSGRILMVSSIAGVRGAPFFATYSAAKFAMEGFSESIAPVLRDGYNIRVSIVEPGPVKTELATKVMDSSLEEQAKNFDPILKDLYMQGVKRMTSGMSALMQSADEIAKLHMDIILSENPHLRYQTSEPMVKQAERKLRDPTTDYILDRLQESYK
ncbi:retinol dehydrogenase 8-like [Acanthaster planci]|uniref:Retinol dehydrogenase 8-like n=1 Tax=Acanthaster planci TaxID=133434 RepID=A0A8B7Y8H4_ACAPL|nr:retinol dehydrogenase 8-like [Acanthaster planci]